MTREGDRCTPPEVPPKTAGVLAAHARSYNDSGEGVEHWQGAGLCVELRHRSQRTAFKAGALAAGLERSDAPFVAIFDADFIPPADFLRRTVPRLLTEPRLALVHW